MQEKVQFLETAISVLNEEDYKLINGLYIDRIAAEKLARHYHCSRQTVYNRCRKLVEMMEEVYAQQFNG